MSFKTNNAFNSTLSLSLMTSFLTCYQYVRPNSEQKDQTNREKYLFYHSVSQIHIGLNPEKTRKKHQNDFLECT